MKTPDAKQWMEALRIEMKQLESLGVFSSPFVLPYGASKIKMSSIFKKKRCKTGAVERWNVRLVAQGFLQTFGVDFFNTQHELKGFKFQTDNGEFNSKACKDLVAAFGGKLITN